jgi:hypothetical protein
MAEYVYLNRGDGTIKHYDDEEFGVDNAPCGISCFCPVIESADGRHGVLRSELQI